MFWQQEGYWTGFCEKKLRDYPMSEKANGSWLQDAGQAEPLSERGSTSRTTYLRRVKKTAVK